MSAIVCTALMIALLVFSDAAMSAALTAARCFVQGVMPALLPMMVLGKMLPNRTKGERSDRKQWMRTVFFAFAAGSPAAAQRARGVRDDGGLSQKSWECLLCMTGVMSPMFFTGTLAGWLGSQRAGWILLGLHWLGAAITAGLWHVFSKADGVVQPSIAPSMPTERITLPSAIAQSAQALLCVCGAMMLFSVAACLIKSVLGMIFPVWAAQHTGALSVLWAVMEIGGGSSAVIDAWQKPQAALSALCGFGGLSILLQNMLFLEHSIRPVKLLMMRAVHGAVCYALVRLFNPF